MGAVSSPIAPRFLSEATKAGWSGVCSDCSPVGAGAVVRVVVVRREFGDSCWRCGGPVTDVQVAVAIKDSPGS